ncbi:putative protease, DJ-1/PfpI family protein, partial [Lacticaseibacillus rhamnosus MTCC 5462]
MVLKHMRPVLLPMFWLEFSEGNHMTKLVSAGQHNCLNCTWGYQCIPNYQLQDINYSDFDALAIPGGFEESGFYRDAFSSEFSKVIQTFDHAKKPIGAICVGGLAVAYSGVLKGRKATTYGFSNSPRQAQMAKY